MVANVGLIGCNRPGHISEVNVRLGRTLEFSVELRIHRHCAQVETCGVERNEYRR